MRYERTAQDDRTGQRRRGEDESSLSDPHINTLHLHYDLLVPQ